MNGIKSNREAKLRVYGECGDYYRSDDILISPKQKLPFEPLIFYYGEIRRLIASGSQIAEIANVYGMKELSLRAFLLEAEHGKYKNRL